MRLSGFKTRREQDDALRVEEEFYKGRSFLRPKFFHTYCKSLEEEMTTRYGADAVSSMCAKVHAKAAAAADEFDGDVVDLDERERVWNMARDMFVLLDADADLAQLLERIDK